jgi:hypothetical protein
MRPEVRCGIAARQTAEPKSGGAEEPVLALRHGGAHFAQTAFEEAAFAIVTREF